ncbi:MAG TPA: hypothetical protein VHA05_00310 [Candidatus Saccharimonadales bacterium]|jgi:hypothetical protein|nr:hypothetical protein [Candidatus Saccharimonadales bacterium]
MKILASHSHKRRKWPAAALVTADLVVFGGTDPSKVPSIGLFLGFLLLIANFYALLVVALKLVAWYGVSPGKHKQRFVRVTAGVFAGLVALQSIGELSARDVLVALPLAFLAYMYLSYGRRSAAVVPDLPPQSA